MTLPENVAGWLRRNRREATDLLALAISQLVALMLFRALPAAAVLGPPIVAALVPFRKSGRPGRWASFLDALPRRGASLAATGLVLRAWSDQPLTVLWFGAIWPVVAAALETDWTFLARYRRANEAARLTLLAAGALWIMRGYFRVTLIGAGDALWYATMLHDTLLQARAGIFPVWVGQSIYQFNGAICPIRIAPAFPYLGVVLDLLTLHRLGTFALLNLMLVLVSVAAVATAYGCLRAMLPDRRWVAAGLALLFVTCPGVLGLAYANDLYMSWTTLPLVPLVWYGTVRSFARRGDPVGLLMLASALGLCWWGHSPIALWSTLLAGLAQVVRLGLPSQRPVRWLPLVLAAGIFSALAAYPIASALLYLPPGMAASAFAPAAPGEITYFLNQTFPAVFLPLSSKGLDYSDLQLGYALWLLLLFGLATLFRGRQAGAAVPLVGAAGLALLLLPIPRFDDLIWSAVPGLLRNTAGNWAASRFCILIAGATIFGVAAQLRAAAIKDYGPRALTGLVLIGCLWSLAEATKFGDGAALSAPPPATAVDWLRPENVQITRFSYSLFPGFPDNFSHGVTDPALENSLVDPATQQPIVRNIGAAQEGGTAVAQGTFRHNPGSFTEGYTLDLRPHLEPDRSYLLEFTFAHPGEIRGSLQLSGDHFVRTYGLPEHGGPLAFGAGGQHSSVIPVWTTAGPEDLTVRFFPQDAAADPADAAVGTVQLLTYAPDRLPIVVDGWLPLQAHIHSPAAGWWRTPRMFQHGYAAAVNGRPVAVQRSADGLTCVPIPAGDSSVRLWYQPPLALAGLFWLALATGGGLVAAAARARRAGPAAPA